MTIYLCPEHEGFCKGSTCCCIDTHTKPDGKPLMEKAGDFDNLVYGHLDQVGEMMVDRHKKYGPGNISEFGELGLLVRLSDKMARLRNNQEDFSDESVDDTVSDIIGYALIWKMVRAGDWPGQDVAK